MKLQVTQVESRSSDREIKPPVKCFCCWDSGRAANEFLSEFVDIPKSGNFQPFICKRYDCEAGERLIAAYEKSDQEREATWQKLAEKDQNTPKFMKQREFQANWSCALPASACESMHKWAFDQWVDRFVKQIKPQYQTVDAPSSTVIEQFTQAVSDREVLFKEIQTEIAKFDPEFVNPKIEKFLKHCCDRNSIQYINIQSLPTSDYSILLSKIKGLAA